MMEIHDILAFRKGTKSNKSPTKTQEDMFNYENDSTTDSIFSWSTLRPT